MNATRGAVVFFSHKNCMQRALVSLSFCLCLASAAFAQEEAQVFSSGDVETTETREGGSSPDHPATAYWHVTATMGVASAVPGAYVQMLLPLSDGRQSILARRTHADGLLYREKTDDLNLWGRWEVVELPTAQPHITSAYTVQIVDTRVALPTVSFPLPAVAEEFRPYLRSSPLIQQDATFIRALARRLTRGCRQAGNAVRALYDYVATLPRVQMSRNANSADDALAVLTTQRGGRAGKARALVALLRAAGMPARVVGGMRLGDTTRKRTTIAWVETLIGETWVPMDPSGGYFAWLPNTYLALYRNDLPLLSHTQQVAVDYTFFIRQLTRSAAYASDEAKLPVANQRPGLRYESEHVHTIAAYVERPRATVVLVHDGAVSQDTVAQVLAAAQTARINVALLSADFTPSSAREHYLQTLIGNNLTLIREANLLIINSADTAGFYALLKQGEWGVKWPDLRVVIAAGVTRPVGQVLAAVVVRVLEPLEVVFVPHQADLVQLWDLARANVSDSLSLSEVVGRRFAAAGLLTTATVEGFGRWRRGVVDLWALAVRSHVPLPALNLILVLPLIAFFLLIIRNVIGLETFGTFSPMLLALAFLTTGLTWGLVIFVLIVGLGSSLRLGLQRLRLHLVSRVAILIAVVAVSMVGLTVLGATIGVGGLLHTSIFPMVIMANMIENFSNTQLERGAGEALRLTFSTLLVAVCSYIAIENTGLKSLVLTFPEVLVAVIGGELLLGRWRGLRLVEYVRFYAVAKKPSAFSDQLPVLMSPKSKV